MQLTGFHPNGLLPNEVASVTRPLDRKRWARAEEIAAKLISCIQPNVASEKHRNAVVSYVKRLITNCMPCQVVTFGSVPLKTYLPDGDIDLTVFSEDYNLKDKWFDEVRDMLEKEEKNEEAEFQVKEVHYIQAEVKIIKCLIDNIVVDISFNQLGGLCTLCFLEEVDNLISQNHLFKRSIILVKAWCYYESRILGAHHGLISTYALETLVLYIFHVFNNSFTGPLEVLYRFLEFFRKFDWANYCVSLWGPVPSRSLPLLAAIPPRNDGGELLLDDLFLSACSRAYSVFPSGLENQEQPFISKHFNIVDPLRVENNLGRSVSKGNFYRIRSAFSLGAEMLGRILQCQEECVVAEVNQIFVNTWSRHSKGCRPDAPVIDVSHALDVNQSHHFLKHTMKNIGATHIYDATSYQEASGWGHFYPWRSYIDTEQKNGEQTCRADMLQNRGCPMPQFSRTFSSPELTNMSSKHDLFKHNVGAEKIKVDADSISIMNHFAKYSTDELHTRDNLCHRNPYHAYYPNNFVRDFKGNPVTDITKSVTSGEEPGQSNVVRDFRNLVSSSGIQNHDGDVQGCFNGASHPLIPTSSQVLEYSHHDFDGTNPSKLTSLGSDCGTIMHYCHGPFPVPASQHLGAVSIRPEFDQERMIWKLNNRAVLAEGGCQDNHFVFWTDGDTNSIRETDLLSDEFSTASSILSPPSPATSSRTKASSECSRDEKLSNMTNPLKSSSGNRTADSLNTTSNVHSGCQVSGEFASDVDNCLNWVTSSTPEAITSSLADLQQLSGFGTSVTDYYHSMSSLAPLLLHPGFGHGVTYNHGALPVTFYPTGPHLPFITMMPLYAERNPGASTYQLNVQREKPKFSASVSGSDVGMGSKPLSHLDNHGSVQRNVSREYSDKIVPDIFQSDFASHWKNLQCGRLCRSSQLQDPFVYPPVVGAPQHFPEHLPFYAPKRPSPVSADAFSHLEPVSALLPGNRTVGFSIQYDEVSKHHNGTGTYFPEPEIFRERECSASRQSHVDHYHNKNDLHRDKEENYNFELKTRLADCAQARHHYEKPNINMVHSAHSPSQTKQKKSFQRTRHCLQHFSKGPCTPKPARKGFKKDDYSTHQMQSAHHIEVSPKKYHPRVKMCTCSKNISCSSSIEELQFGSVRPHSFVDVGNVPEPHGGYKRGGNHNQKNYHGGDSG